MKNIVAKLTLRQLKLNKRRTLITIIGIALSVAMLTATSTFISSYVDGMHRESIKTQGEYHAEIFKMPMENTDKIKDEFPNVEEILFVEEVGYAPIPQQDSKRFIYIEGYSQNAFNHFSITLADGRLPQNDNELIVSDQAAAAGYTIGQNITVDLGYRACREKPKRSGEEGRIQHLAPFEAYCTGNNSYYPEEFVKTDSKTYTIVGVFSDRARNHTSDTPYSPVFEAISFLDPATIKADQKVSPFILFSNTKNVDSEDMRNAAENVGAEYFFPNSAALPFQGFDTINDVTMVCLLYLSIFIIIIIIGSVAFIYNAFAISLADRSRYLGLLSCIGASNKQKRFSALLEGIVLGAIAIPLGLLAGFGITAATFKLLGSYLYHLIGVEFRLAVSPAAVIASILLSILTIFLSLIVPMIKAAKSPPIEAVRRANNIVTPKKPIRASKLTKKLFGFDGELALKNIKRSPRRYRITVASLTLSVIMLLVTVGGLNVVKTVYALEDEDRNIDYNAVFLLSYGDDSTSRQELDTFREIFDELSKNPKTEWITHNDRVPIDGIVSADDLADNEAAERFKRKTIVSDNNKKLINISLISSETRYRDISKKGPMDDVKDDGAVLINRGEYEPYGETYQTLHDKIFENVPDEIDIMLAYYKSDASDEIKNLPNIIEFTTNFTFNNRTDPDSERCGVPLGTVKIGSSTDTQIVEDNLGDSYPGLQLVVRNELFEKIVGEIEKAEPTPDHDAIIFIRSDDPYEACRIANEIAGKNGIRISMVNWEEKGKKVDSGLTILSAFLGGFTALMILICIANIINTITTGISLRRREFAMLKSSGMSPEAFRRMVKYESLLYAFKSLIYGVPISMIILLCIVFATRKLTHLEITFFAMFPWLALVIAIIAIFLLVGSTSLYALKKAEKDTIIDVLKDENT